VTRSSNRSTVDQPPYIKASQAAKRRDAPVRLPLELGEAFPTFLQFTFWESRGLVTEDITILSFPFGLVHRPIGIANQVFGRSCMLVINAMLMLAPILTCSPTLIGASTFARIRSVDRVAGALDIVDEECESSPPYRAPVAFPQTALKEFGRVA
jgi:hypothetical protein